MELQKAGHERATEQLQVLLFITEASVITLSSKGLQHFLRIMYI